MLHFVRFTVHIDGEEGELFEGDIILSTAEKREILESNMHILQERMAMQDGPDGSGQQLGSILTDDTRWTNGLVPFKFDGNLGECAVCPCDQHEISSTSYAHFCTWNTLSNLGFFFLQIATC